MFSSKYMLTLIFTIIVIDFLGYKIFVRTNSHETHETLNNGKAISHTISSLKCGTKYQVYMIAFNEIGESEPTEALSFQTDGGGKIFFLIFFFPYFDM